MNTQTIELDCAPGSTRPDAFIGEVIKGTGLPKKEECNTFFGNWTWDYSEIESKVWKKIQPTLKERIVELYNTGCIRYGSW